MGQVMPCRSHAPRLLGAQSTFIGQRYDAIRSPYTGPMSFTAGGDRQMSESYGVYGGLCAGWGLDLYLDVEMIRGDGISHASGLAGVTNGDVIRQGSADLGDNPYVARAFVRWSYGLGGTGRDTVNRAQDDLPRVTPSRRIEVTAGLFAASDLFDLNRYANSTRTQFLNWGLFQNLAWDFAANTRGYTNGVAVSFITPAWKLRAGSFQMPLAANGNVFDGDFANAHGHNVELTFNAPRGVVLRLLAYLNQARMGRYAEATRIGAAAGVAPNIVADDAPGRTKFGVGLNAEVPLADDGETGAFARLGWSDGRNESFAFTEADAHVSGGVQVAGGRWSRAADRLGLAVLIDGLSSAHRDYLAAGGRGFLLGDGRLNYGEEMVTELYYRVQIGPWIQLSPDVQWIVNPGYNRDRGPATVLTLRASARW
jgi:high affinity Mn2+ porin